MGQAKRRGTYEQRKQKAIEKGWIKVPIKSEKQIVNEAMKELLPIGETQEVGVFPGGRRGIEMFEYVLPAGLVFWIN